MILDSPIEIFMNLKFRLFVAATVFLSTLCVAQSHQRKSTAHRARFGCVLQVYWQYTEEVDERERKIIQQKKVNLAEP
jgi:hypothetical protein